MFDEVSESVAPWRLIHPARFVRHRHPNHRWTIEWQQKHTKSVAEGHLSRGGNSGVSEEKHDGSK